MYNNRKINIIVATELNGGIGYKNQLPWPKIPEDIKWFKEKTLGNIVIMGRNTAESIGHLLPDRHNVIITSSFPRQILEKSPNQPHSVYNNLSLALKMITEHPIIGKIFIIGGAQLYQSAMDMKIVDRIYQTHIQKPYQSDTHFNLPDKFDLTWDSKLLEQCKGFEKILWVKL